MNDTFKPIPAPAGLRDEIAMRALAALITEPQWQGGSIGVVAQLYPDRTTEDVAQFYATAAYRIADAMMKARNEGSNGND